MVYKPFRGLTEQTLKRYGVKARLKDDGSIHSVVYPWGETFTQVRLMDEKSFYFQGVVQPGLFGFLSFPDPSDICVITEGANDACSAYQMLGYHSFSVRSASSALTDLRASFDRINKYKSIYFCFDNDDPGRKALAQCVTLFDFQKTYIFDLNKWKDANEYLTNGDIEAFRLAFKKARKYVPEGVTSSFEDVSAIFDEAPRKVVARYPFKELDIALQGLAFHESTLFSGLEGIGKTEVLRALEYEVLKTTDHNVGIIHLEESQKSTINRLLSYELQVPLLKEYHKVNKEDKLDAYKRMVRRDNRVFYYSFFGEHDPDTLLGIIRYLVAVCDCKFIFFDHINLVVSSLDRDSDERRTLDYLSTKLAALLQELEFHLSFICHANDNGQTRGSRNISQAAHVHVRLERETSSSDEIERKRIHFNIYKNRPTSMSGPAGYSWFDDTKGVLLDPNEISDTNFLTKLPDVV